LDFTRPPKSAQNNLDCILLFCYLNAVNDLKELKKRHLFVARLIAAKLERQSWHCFTPGPKSVPPFHTPGRLN
jgi:hypothetical protein